MKIIPFEKAHWPAVRKIYQDGIDTGIATFEDLAPDWNTWDRKYLDKCRIVAVDNNDLVGWAGLQMVSSREAYKGVAEETVYVHTNHLGKGIGTLLLESLVRESEREGFWMLTASIFASNTISIRMHKGLRFGIVGTRERIAQKDGKWIDIILMDRRSDRVGID